MEMLSSLVPTLTEKYLSDLLRTSKGPSYGVWSGDFLNSRLTKTNLALPKLFGTFSLLRPWMLAGTGLSLSTRSRS